jgi:Zn-dependent M28 family amino/carboxypeptidase
MRKSVPIILLILLISFNAFAEESPREYVRVLSSVIGKRNIDNYQNLEKAADYIRTEFKKFGYRPTEQAYYLETRPPKDLVLRNIIAVKEGKDKKDKIILVCAHYDTFKDTPGADDNASGVSVLLELARLLREEDLSKTVKFAAFTNEDVELAFEDRDMGSYRYAREARARGEDIEAVICLDMLGFYSDEAGSQKSPLILKFFYPDRGNFVGICSDSGSYDLLKTAVSEFKRATDLPVQYLAAPAPFLPQIMTSDHRSFWAFGYNSIWINDTCIYRNSYMHTANDTYDTLDYKDIDKIVEGTRNIILKLAK